jgi:beta-lactamase class A
LTISTPAIAAQAATAAAPGLDRQLAVLAEIPEGRAGIAVIDLASGREYAVNGNQRFAMASVAKLPLALTFLAAVDAGRQSLDREIELPDRFRHSDGFTEILVHPGIRLSTANWIELMLTQSDNSAADLLFAEVGGPPAVQRWLDAHQLKGIRVDRDIAALLLDDTGLPRTPGASDVQSLRDADRLPRLTDAQLDAAARRFDADTRDTATPLGMARLLAALDKGTLVSAASRKSLLDTLSRTRTGADRLRAGLPKGTRVEHKTGTLRGISADVGIITLPSGRRFAIAAFTQGIAKPAARATLIANAARAAFDSLSR